MRIVYSLDELARLPRDRRVNGFGVRETLQLEIPTLTRQALIRAQGSLNRLQSRCGCVGGAALMVIALVLGVLGVLDRHASLLAWRPWYELGLVFLASFVLGFVAKMATLAFTRWQFAWRCRAQYRALSRLTVS